NIANVNTTGFKARRVLFQSQFSRTLGIGSGASSDFGGTNPMQIGLGSQVAQIDTDFSMGSVEVTGINSDLAIEGSGFFILNSDSGLVYTRNGSFSVNNQGFLVSAGGEFVQGFGIDTDFNLVPGALVNLTVPLGFLTVARPTTEAVIQGNLNSEGEAANQGSLLTSAQLEDLAGNPVTDDTLLTEVCLSSNPGVALFAVGDVVTLEGQKGGRTLDAAEFTVDATSRLGDSALVPEANRFSVFMEQGLGIDTDATLPTVGSVSIVGSCLQIAGNSGTQNDIEMATGAIRINGTDTPFTWDDSQAANGESVYTSFTVYDSLGNPMTMDVTFVLEDKDTTGTTWRFYMASGDDTDIDLVLGNGTIQFDNDGQYVTSTGLEAIFDRDATGAVTPQSIFLELSTMTSLSDGDGSQIALSSQDGVPIGTLDGFGVGSDGIITGTFTNGLTRPMGQVALATFANPKGLLDAGSSTFVEGPNSGVAVVTTPQSMSAGSIQSGALELSNVDLSKEFVNLITTSTGFSANSRVISTADEMMREILQMVR
ncbi:MAG: flagellar hook-basal body complex protein, partial [Planctomycetes bacterium]|nr:flagellar hook-basal body complex protein [Planctomycetota bacterium]